ncbi:hypothetical protein AG1IA_09906 [Rhizoctonia solani AG-1 IA]|uniref:Uncharacterized protein n=1 Tax=Thanatephorus cucumeris (strain AG1-IA) TaxID=983506 RepID=L8WDM4_THACA|nr:hypothetical protein AG1IA_09906 [Rhizoctonia solani AG-1 IA]
MDQEAEPALTPVAVGVEDGPTAGSDTPAPRWYPSLNSSHALGAVASRRSNNRSRWRSRSPASAAVSFPSSRLSLNQDRDHY